MATILIVDDLVSNRHVLATPLRSQGHRLLEAADGYAALAIAAAEHPDMVITDVLMPAMDGYELVRQLRLDATTAGIPVVFYTAHYGAREARAFALSSGVSHILAKPVDSAEVLAIVERVLSGQSPAPIPLDSSVLATEFDREHLRLLTDKLSDKTADLRTANARLRAMINIALELASQRDPGRLLQSVAVAARDLFAATYVTLGIVDRNDRTIQRLIMSGGDEAAPWIQIGDAVAGLLATVVAERRVVRGDNPGSDPVRLDLPALHPAIEAFLIAPIASPAHVYGWICLVGNEGRTFTEDDEPLVTALAGLVGRIYENGHFYAVARQERDRAQRYLDTAEVILLALDIEGRITLVNRYACSVLGWTADELLGRDWIQTCLPPRIREGFAQTFHHLLGGHLSVAENPVLTRSGEERLIDWRNTILRDEAGQVVGTLSSGTDITDRNRAIEAMQAAEERMRFALRNANIGIWDMDPTTGALQWSETLEAHYGLPPGAFGGTLDACIECIHPDDRASALETMRAAMKSGANFSVQNRSIWPDGSVRWLSGAGRFQLGQHGEPVRGVGISQDVTDRHTLEGQYQQAQKMDAVGRLAGGVAHDFNNLLTVILGHCGLLLDDCDPSDPRRADIANIQTAGTRAAGLTRQLLAFSRREVIEPTVLDLNAVVTDMRGMLGRLIREDVKVVLTLRSGLGPVKADRGQVEQIVVNVAVNGRDAMPKGGTLTIETANVELDEHHVATHAAAKTGHHIVLTVTDTGCGMTPQVQARLFEPFFTTKGPGKGTGLGLATVHSIVDRSGGSIDVHSEVGSGSAFKIYFPRAEGVEIAVTAPPPVARSGHVTQTVLVVEDADSLRELTKRLLERQGYAVLLAANANEAAELFKRNTSIDVLLTDVVMPGQSGPELTERLIEQRPGLKVIYMSGYTDDSIVDHGVLSAEIALLRKPFTAETLGRKIREVLDG